MSTTMTEQDWNVALAVFRASLPRRGAKARDDRLFVEALHYFAVHNITWRAVTAHGGGLAAAQKVTNSRISSSFGDICRRW